MFITYKRPLLRTTLQSGCLFFRVLMEDATFIGGFIIHRQRLPSTRFLHKSALILYCQILKKVHLYYMSEESTSKSRNPENYTFLDKEALSKYTTDTGKILPRSTQV